MVDLSGVYIMNKRVSFERLWGPSVIVFIHCPPADSTIIPEVHQQTTQKLFEIPLGIKQAFNCCSFVGSNNQQCY